MKLFWYSNIISKLIFFKLNIIYLVCIYNNKFAVICVAQMAHVNSHLQI